MISEKYFCSSSAVSLFDDQCNFLFSECVCQSFVLTNGLWINESRNIWTTAKQFRKLLSRIYNSEPILCQRELTLDLHWPNVRYFKCWRYHVGPTLNSGVARRRKVGGHKLFFQKSEKQKKKKKIGKKGYSGVKAQHKGGGGLLWMLLKLLSYVQSVLNLY